MDAEVFHSVGDSWHKSGNADVGGPFAGDGLYPLVVTPHTLGDSKGIFFCRGQEK